MNNETLYKSWSFLAFASRHFCNSARKCSFGIAGDIVEASSVHHTDFAAPLVPTRVIWLPIVPVGKEIVFSICCFPIVFSVASSNDS